MMKKTRNAVSLLRDLRYYKSCGYCNNAKELWNCVGKRMFKTCSDCGVINYSKTAKLKNRLIDCLKAISFIEFSESSQNVRKKNLPWCNNTTKTNYKNSNSAKLPSMGPVMAYVCMHKIHLKLLISTYFSVVL